MSPGRNVYKEEVVPMLRKRVHHKSVRRCVCCVVPVLVLGLSLTGFAVAPSDSRDAVIDLISRIEGLDALSIAANLLGEDPAAFLEDPLGVLEGNGLVLPEGAGAAWIDVDHSQELGIVASGVLQGSDERSAILEGNVWETGIGFISANKATGLMLTKRVVDGPSRTGVGAPAAVQADATALDLLPSECEFFASLVLEISSLEAGDPAIGDFVADFKAFAVQRALRAGLLENGVRVMVFDALEFLTWDTRVEFPGEPIAFLPPEPYDEEGVLVAIVGLASVPVAEDPEKTTDYAVVAFSP